MPSVFRHPADDPKSINSSYYGLVGEGTIFSPKDVVGFRDITDGSSYTLAVVEAKRTVPWTKPEDIPFDPKKDVPKLGGWYQGAYHMLLCDGSVRFISDALDKTLLKRLIQMNDGQPLNSNLPQSTLRSGSERPLLHRKPTDTRPSSEGASGGISDSRKAAARFDSRQS